ncbi:MAG: hypothetical protein NVSMB62_08800 [Acidobacteriaceae bacterium]
MRSTAASDEGTAPESTSEEGFLLLGAIVAIALVLLILAIAAPRVARSLRREREVEAVHRGQQYIRAIQLYYRKFGHYPGSMDQLEHTNTTRFLRQRYVDPITGKDDFTPIPVGQNKTTVKTFFGQPIAGLPAAGVGSASGIVSPGIGQPGAASGSGAGGFGSTPASGLGGSSVGGFGSGGFGSTTTSPAAAAPTTAGPGTTPIIGAPGSATSAANDSSGTSGSASATGGIPGSQSATTFSGTAQPFMGVSLGAHGNSIVEYNEQTTFEGWEFLYDPRLDQLKAKAAALNGGIGSTPATSLGSGFGQPGAAGAPGSFGSPGIPGPATTPTPPPASPGSAPPSTQP